MTDAHSFTSQLAETQASLLKLAGLADGMTPDGMSDAAEAVADMCDSLCLIIERSRRCLDAVVEQSVRTGDALSTQNADLRLKFAYQALETANLLCGDAVGELGTAGY